MKLTSSLIEMIREGKCPYYVELPEEAEHNDLGLKTYGAYYVPAVEGRYLNREN